MPVTTSTAVASVSTVLLASVNVVEAGDFLVAKGKIHVAGIDIIPVLPEHCENGKTIGTDTESTCVTV